MRVTNQITMPSRPTSPTRKQRHRFDLYWHLRDYYNTRAFHGEDAAHVYGVCILKRIEQLGGLAARW